ncbi:hypothetical protein F4861DRAFT_136388 [Xylaria intraflava]|nr:hypothetical protein F4861DRAFT_136388 [Xylaria intraflava]
MRRGRIIIPFRGPARPARPPERNNAWETTPEECAEAKRILAKATHFPPEIVDIVMDLAEYWVCSVASIDYSVAANEQFKVYGASGRENQFLLRTEPMGLTAWHSNDQERWQTQAPAFKLEEEYSRKELQRFIEGPSLTLAHPLRKLVFDITSKDQGWGGDYGSKDTFRSSWTWFDAGIDRFDKGHICSTECMENSEDGTANASEGVPTTCSMRPVWPPLKENLSEYDHQLFPAADHKIQCNLVAADDWQRHHVEWSWTDDIDPESSASQELDEKGRGSNTGDGSFVRSLRIGDMVTIWAHARYPGWVNNVRKVQVRACWAV